MFVNHSTIARWENGTRLPDAAMISRLAKCLGVDTNTLFRLAAESEESPNVIMVEDSKVILTEGLTILGDAGSRWLSWISNWERPAGLISAGHCWKSIPAPMWCF